MERQLCAEIYSETVHLSTFVGFRSSMPISLDDEFLRLPITTQCFTAGGEEHLIVKGLKSNLRPELKSVDGGFGSLDLWIFGKASNSN